MANFDASSITWDDAPKAAFKPEEVAWDDAPKKGIADMVREAALSTAHLINPLEPLSPEKRDIGGMAVDALTYLPRLAAEGGGELGALAQGKDLTQALGVRDLIPTATQAPAQTVAGQAGEAALSIPSEFVKWSGETTEKAAQNAQKLGLPGLPIVPGVFAGPEAAGPGGEALSTMAMLALGGKEGARLPKTRLTPEAVDAYMRAHPEPAAPAHLAGAGTAPAPAQITAQRATDLSHGDPVSDQTRAKVQSLSDMVEQAVSPPEPPAGSPPPSLPAAPPVAKGAPAGPIPAPPPEVAHALHEAAGGDKGKMAAIIQQATGGKLEPGETPENLADIAHAAMQQPTGAGAPLHPDTPVNIAPVPLAGGVLHSTGGPEIAIDPRMPAQVTVPHAQTGAPVQVDTHTGVAAHEAVEWPLMHLDAPMNDADLHAVAARAGLPSVSELPAPVVAKLRKGEALTYPEAHDIATLSENHHYATQYGVNPEHVQKAMTDGIEAAKAQAPGENVPVTLDQKPYEDDNQMHLLAGARTGPDFPTSKPIAIAPKDTAIATAPETPPEPPKVPTNPRLDTLRAKGDARTPAEQREYTALLQKRQTQAGMGEKPRAFEPTGNAVTDRFATKLQDHDAAVTEYAALPESSGGTVLNTDVARELSPDYVANRTLSADVHEPASTFIKRLYADKLAAPTPEGKESTVLFTAGGTGAGKTSGLSAAGEEIGKPEITYDTNMNKLDSATSKIDQALAAGRDVKIVYVYRDPVEAFRNGALPRAMRMEGRLGSGRTVPLDEHIKTHVGASEVIRKIEQKYAGDGRVQIYAVDNSRGHGNEQLSSLDKLPKVEENGLRGKLEDQLEQAHAAGEISDAIHNGFKGVGREAGGSDAVGPQGPVGEGRTASTEPSSRAIAELSKDERWPQFLAENAGNTRLPAVFEEAAKLASEVTHEGQSSPVQATERPSGTEADASEPVGRSGESGEQASGAGSAVEGAAGEPEAAAPEVKKFVGPKYQRGAATVSPIPIPKKVKLPPRRPGESQKDWTKRITAMGKKDLTAALAVKQRKMAWSNFRAMLAQEARAMDTTDALFAENRKLFDQTPEKINLATIDQWETGKPITDADARRFFEKMQGAFDQRIQKIQEQRPDAMKSLIENYFPHIYKDPVKATALYQSMGSKRPLRGDRSFLKQRNWPTLKEAIASGLEPVSTNLVDLATLKLHQMDKFIAMNDFMDDLKERGWMKRIYAGDPMPEGYARVEDAAFKGSHAFTIPDPEGGEPKAMNAQWDMVVPEAIAHDINNYLAPSLYRFPAWGALRATQNVIMSARLGWSLFHAGFTTIDNAVMLADVGLRKTLRGDVLGGLLDMVSAPVGALTSPFEGAKLNRYWRGIETPDRNTDAILKMLEVGGARWKQSMSDYNNALPKIRSSIRQMIANRKDFDLSDLTAKDLTKGVGKGLGNTLQAIGEVSSWLIHHWLVPNQKMAARAHLAKYELDRLAGSLGKEKGDYAGIVDAMHPDVLKQISGHIIDVIDDRLGHMTYDHWNWLPKMAREAAQGAVGALGWQVGVVRTVTGGAVDLPQIFSPEKFVDTLDKAGKVEGDMGRVPMRLTSLVTLATMMAGIGYLTQKLMTGEDPSELKDYFFPKTGRRNADDSEERLQYPSYWQDHYKLATAPGETAMHKVHPMWGMLMEAFANQDYYGVQIRDSDAPWVKQAEEIGEYVAKGFMPYSATNLAKAKANRATTGQQAASMVGVNVAPRSVSQTDFQRFVSDKAYAALPKGVRTKEQAERSDKLHAAEDQLRHGESVADWDSLSAADQAKIEKAADMTVPEIRFLRLGVEDKIRAYDKATPAERDRYHLAQHMPTDRSLSRSKVFQRLPTEEKDAVRERLRKIDEDRQ